MSNIRLRLTFNCSATLCHKQHGEHILKWMGSILVLKAWLRPKEVENNTIVLFLYSIYHLYTMLPKCRFKCVEHSLYFELIQSMCTTSMSSPVHLVSQVQTSCLKVTRCFHLTHLLHLLESSLSAWCVLTSAMCGAEDVFKTIQLSLKVPACRSRLVCF